MAGSIDTTRFRDALGKRVPPQQFKTWFSTVAVERSDDEEVVLTTDTSFKREWLERYYGQVLGDVVAETFGTAVRYAMTVAAAAPAAPPARVAREVERTAPRAMAAGGDVAPAPRPIVRHSVPKDLDGPSLVLNQKYTFDNFVVGPSNQFAHAAARAVAEKPAGSYNPLFLHSYVGLGKTHLLQAICHQAITSAPNGRVPNVLYLSSETFMNEFISSVGKGELDRFRYRYRNADILLIDDIHLLANKERTQEEFFNTFNTLYNADRQIVLSSDSPPDEIPSLRERLVSRFKWGLVAEIRPPGFETRLAILRHKAESMGVAIPEDVLSFLAETIDTNIRELEGAITKTVAYAQLTGQTFSLDLAHQALGLGPRDATQQVTAIERILNVVCKHYSVTLGDIVGRKRTQSITLPRQVAMYLARRLTPHSLEEIGSHFGKRDHTTVLYGVDKIRGKAKDDSRFQQLLNDLEARIQR